MKVTRCFISVITLLAGSAHAAATAKDPLSSGNLLSVFLGLLLVVALLLAAAWMIRRFQRVQAPREGALQVTAQLSLGLKERVILVRVGNENVLLGCTPGSIRSLHSWRGDLPTGAEPAEPTQSAPDFMTHLRGVLAAQGLRRPGASS
ncbi:MAG: flagellar biosynthetic protein FliO [Paraperlucidibaca sp.]